MSLLAEHGRLGSRALVLTFDGTGYGSDGDIWGGEALLLGPDVGRFARVGHLRPVALPGGDAAVAEPWRIALAHLEAAGIAWVDGLAPVREAGERAVWLRRLLRSEVSVARSTSMGRLFDAVASLLDVCQAQRYEAQAAIELEQCARAAAGGNLLDHPPLVLPVALAEPGGSVLDPAPMLAEIVAARRRGVPDGDLAWAFHAWVGACVVRWAEVTRARAGITTVGLSGGVFTNELLASGVRAMLTARGFEVLTHSVVPAGDGGLALGQAVVAAARLRSAADPDRFDWR
ncbi:hypothetical protein [Xylanimonas allomyrinae]|uniref:Kae1-like domain-containing protein n=1 Tax=Xylanimonas allomyrinae TaxID=2509459 RepID=UPI001B874CC2|nr:hypothetical protein [Xylanimonas allomyrinae]